MKVIVLSQESKAPEVFGEGQRFPALAALEARLRAAGNTSPVRGNAAFRKFSEGEAPSVTWGDARLDIVECK